VVEVKNQIDSPEMEQRALEALDKAGKAVTVEFIATATGLAWHQARSLLFKLVAQKRCGMIMTTRGWIFEKAEAEA